MNIAMSSNPIQNQITYHVAYITPAMLHRIQRLLAREQKDREQRSQAYYEKGLAKNRTSPRPRVNQLTDAVGGLQIVGNVDSDGTFTATVSNAPSPPGL